MGGAELAETGTGPWAHGGIGRVMAHAEAGCAGAMASGGSCGRGAMTAGFSEGVGGNLGKYDGVVARAVLGGTVSVIGGGKFSNGAVMGAYAYLFNHMQHLDGLQAAANETVSQAPDTNRCSLLQILLVVVMALPRVLMVALYQECLAVAERGLLVHHTKDHLVQQQARSVNLYRVSHAWIVELQHHANLRTIRHRWYRNTIRQVRLIRDKCEALILFNLNVQLARVVRELI